ncbi:BRCA1-associated protein-like [Rhopilema esculentum]|uniref:BRCA1-associated protein-like n=1 Tax=Rhopilema esculentum TaxID=499914 RepID=UPI0031D32B19
MPSVSLVVLRLEVEDGFKQPQSFNYVSEEYLKEVRGKRVARMDKKEKEDTTTDGLVDDVVLSSNKQTHRGCRVSTNFTIETHTCDEAPLCANNEDPSAVAKPNPAAQAGTVTKRSRTSPVPFFSGNPMVEHTAGVLHLYKDGQLTPLEEEVPRSEMICMMSVPAKLTCIDLQQFTQPMKDSIQHMQIVRDNSPNQYIVLLKFKDQLSADSFYKDFNGRPYNLLEPEVARLVYVAKLESVKSSEGGYLPVSGLTELPTCPVCLERMDESVEGILTILCNHSFHGDCLVQWSDSSCPVCRYNQTPEAVAEQRCFQCNSTESLWICLICGHIGCGRYKDQHAYQHYQQTGHTFSMQLENQRVWDYTGDNYVHRLVQNKSDGKFVAVDNETDVVSEEKLDSLNLEYTYLLTSQLESQRLHFEEKMTLLEKDAMDKIASIEGRMKSVIEDNQKLSDRLQQLEKEKKHVDKKYTQVVSKVGTLVHDLKEEKEMNTCMLENKRILQKKLDELEEKSATLEVSKNLEIAELKEQLQDLMRHLSIQSAVASSSEDTRKELQDGQVFVKENQTQPRAKASPSKKGKGNRDR